MQRTGESKQFPGILSVIRSEGVAIAVARRGRGRGEGRGEEARVVERGRWSTAAWHLLAMRKLAI